MSRTDKDRPHWVTAEWWEERHWGCQVTYYGTTQRVCSLPALQRRNPQRSLGQCYWYPVWTYYPHHAPGRDTLRLLYHGPQRRAVRDTGRKALAEYRATGTVDVLHDTRQARHSVGYWDRC